MERKTRPILVRHFVHTFEGYTALKSSLAGELAWETATPLVAGHVRFRSEPLFPQGVF